MHSFFFGKKSAYILVFDCSIDPKEIISKNKIDYWLNFLNSQIGKDSSLMFIATKFDILENKYSNLFGKNNKKIQETLLEINQGKF